MLAIWPLVPLPFLNWAWTSGSSLVYVLLKPSLENAEHGPAYQNKTQFTPQSVSPIRKLPEASYPYSLEGRQNENHSHRKLTKLITWTTAVSNSLKLWAMPCRATQGHGGEFRQNVVHWRREWQTTSVFLPWEPHEQYEKAKRYMTLKDELPRLVGAQYTTRVEK